MCQPETTRVIPQTRYAKAPDGISIAYQTIGEGPIDLLWIPGFHGNLEVMWEQRLIVAFFSRLASFARVIFHDRRATGLSDRATSLPDLETQVDDVRTVLDAAGSTSTVILGSGEGAYAAAVFAGTYPKRTSALVLYAATARVTQAPDYPWGISEDERAHDVRLVEDMWGTEAYASVVMAEEAASMVEDRAFVRWYAKVMRHWVSPSSAAELVRIYYETDIRGVLPTLRVPTLVVSREWKDTEEDRYVFSLIPDARSVRFPGGEDTALYVADHGELADSIRDFMGLERSGEELDTVLRTVLFTDMVGSTERVAALGDIAWKGLVERYHDIEQVQLRRFRGVEVDRAGDGLFATFEGPAAAVRCAHAIGTSVLDLGIKIRSGVHTGEVQIIDNKVGGIAVHIGARIAGLAGPSEVLVSQTVKDLVAGSALTLADRGEHELKGVPGAWRLYAVVED